MKKLLSLLFALLMLTTVAFAENGLVIYDGNAHEFIFEPGSEYSPTDLFSEFKDVMPGDRLTQTITVRNDSPDVAKVKIYMCSRGAHPGSGEFLSQLKLRVECEKNELFDNAANEAIPLVDWVCLGTLYSGGSVDLNVTLEVPVELGNEYSSQIGYLDWYFMVEEFMEGEEEVLPEENAGEDSSGSGNDTQISDGYLEEDGGGKNAGGQNPFTGDNANLWLWIVLMAVAVIGITVLFLTRKKKK